MLLTPQTYTRSAVAGFCRIDEEFGGFSNMSRAYPFQLYGVRVRTTEHLYQAMRFPDRPDVQRMVLAARKPKAAKLIARYYDELTRGDWMDVRIDVMRWCLSIKLGTHAEDFGALLRCAGERPIVEISRRDQFWGAAPEGQDQLHGTNVLGQLLDEQRGRLDSLTQTQLRIVSPPPIRNFRFLWLPVGTVYIKPERGQIALISSREIYEMKLGPQHVPGVLASWCFQAQLNGEIKTVEDARQQILAEFAPRQTAANELPCDSVE